MSSANPNIDKLATESTLAIMLENRAADFPGHTALMFRGTSWTYKELNETADRLATALLKLGVTKDDRIAVIMPTRPEWLFVWFAAAKIGCSVVGLNFRYKQDEVVYMVGEAQPRFMVCISEFAGINYADFFAGIRDKIPSLEHFIFLGHTNHPGARDLDTLLKTPADEKLLKDARKEVRPEADHFIIFTSGSTGRPKGAVLTQKSIMAMLRPWVKNLELVTDDLLLNVLPINHVGGGTLCTMGTMASGAQLMLCDVFDPAASLDMIAEYQITAFGGVPTVFALFFSLPNFDKNKLNSVKMMIYGGSPATPDLLKSMVDNTNAVILACYGATEVSGFCTYTSRQDPIQKVLDNTVGRAPEGVELSIVDPTNHKPKPIGEVGEVAVRGDLLIDRYLNAPDITAQSFDQDGWFYTGDMGFLDKDGYLSLVGRYKEMYICGGFNVYPKEVEDILMQHPDVAMVAVLGVPHPKMGEAGMAFIMRKPGSTVDPEALKALCADHLADYKVPAEVIIRDTLPMTALGKIHKPTLYEEFQQ